MEKKALAGQRMQNSTHATVPKRNMMDYVKTMHVARCCIVSFAHLQIAYVRGEILLKERRY